MVDEAQTQLTTWPERLQSEYVDLKTKLGALMSHLAHNTDIKVLNLLRRQETAMRSYLIILEERLTYHEIEIPGSETTNAD